MLFHIFFPALVEFFSIRCLREISHLLRRMIRHMNYSKVTVVTLLADIQGTRFTIEFFFRQLSFASTKPSKFLDYLFGL